MAIGNHHKVVNSKNSHFNYLTDPLTVTQLGDTVLELFWLLGHPHSLSLSDCSFLLLFPADSPLNANALYLI